MKRGERSLALGRTLWQQATSVSLANAVKWPSSQLAQRTRSRLTRIQLGVICTTILLSALGVRFLHWQDRHVEIVSGKASLAGVLNRYRKEATRMLDEGGILFPREQPADGNARLLAHPPGYSILLAAIYRVGGDEYNWLWVLQVLCDAAAALLVFLIALELLNWWAALSAAMLTAVSPHLAYYSLLLSPDSLAVPPILLAVYLVIRGLKRPRVSGMMLAGALVGVSCWLTANAMLLALFLGVAVVLLFEQRRRLMLVAVLVGSTVMVIAPLTIRNLIVFHRFIPLSIQAGLSLVEGIGDYDIDGKLGMPRSDREARQKDVEWNGRPDYAGSLWSPNGIDRDHTRLERGLAVVRSNPGWFLGVMLHRAGFMLSYNDSIARPFPFNTSSVPPVNSEASYGHRIETTDDRELSQCERAPALVLNAVLMSGVLAVRGDQPVKSSPPSELNDTGAAFTPQTRVSLARDGQALEVVGDNSEYGDQFVSGPIAVRKNTDYVLELPVSLLNGGMALKVTSSERETFLAIADIATATQEAGLEGKTAADSDCPARMTVLQMPFASGNRTEVRVVLSNDGRGPTAPAALLGTLEIFETGPTPYAWTGYARSIINSVQGIFTTGLMLTLIVIGVSLLLLARRVRTLVILLIVPLYYLTLQSPLHTEYRYILTIHYFLFVMAGVTLGCFGAALGQATRWVVGIRSQRSEVRSQKSEVRSQKSEVKG
jgi:dolichyl-phosphate-mannose-protein mannosyltransferase